MGRPLRKLHQTHFCISVPLGTSLNWELCKIRTTPISAFALCPSAWRHPDLVSKNGRLEKADRETTSQRRVSGTMIQTPDVASNRASEPSLVRHFTPRQSRLYQPPSADSGVFLLLVRALKKNHQKTTLARLVELR